MVVEEQADAISADTDERFKKSVALKVEPGNGMFTPVVAEDE